VDCTYKFKEANLNNLMTFLNTNVLNTQLYNKKETLNHVENIFLPYL